MWTRTVAVPTTATTIAALIDENFTRVSGIALQAPAANAGDVLFGGPGGQAAFIPSGSSSDVLPIKRTTDLLIKGTSGDTVIILLF